MSREYHQDVESVYSPISRTRQKELYQKMLSGSADARNQIVHSCLPLVMNIANSFHKNNRHIEIDDLVQEGNIALVKAVDNWDGEKSSITTVVTHYVRNAMTDVINSSKYRIRTKYDITKYAAKDIRAIKECGLTEIKDISKATGIKEKRVKKLKSIIDTGRVSYSKTSFKITNEDISKESLNTSGCVADIINLINENITDERERKVFLVWLTYVNKNDKTRLTANETGESVDFVLSSIKKNKKRLKQLCRSTT